MSAASQTAARTAHGLDMKQYRETAKSRPAAVSDRLRVGDDVPEAVECIGTAILTADAADRAACWALVPTHLRDAVVTYVTGIPATAGCYALPEGNGTSGAFTSTDALLPDTLDALASPLYDAHGRPGVVLPQSVAGLLYDAWQVVTPTLDRAALDIVTAWLTVPECVQTGAVNYSAVARAAGLIATGTSRPTRAPMAVRDGIAHVLATFVRDVENAAAVLMSEADRPTLGGVRDVIRHPVSADRLTPSQVYREAYTRDYRTSWRDVRPSARDMTGGFPWAGTSPATVAPLSDEDRAALYGEHARISQARLRAALGPALHAVPREWRTVTGAGHRAEARSWSAGHSCIYWPRTVEKVPAGP